MTKTVGSLIIDIEDKALSQEEAEMLAHPLVGGVILFARNYDSPKQIEELCRLIRLSRQTQKLIMVDQEGGRVQRFINGLTKLPCMARLGKRYDSHAEQASQLATDCGWLMATEILSMGVDLSLAPVLDLNKGKNSVIGQRAFHSNPFVVSDLAKAFVKGMRQAGMASLGKHFPGHGSVAADSHVVMPKDDRTFSMIEKDDMIPFIELIKANIQALMPAHIVFREVDSHPVGFSKLWLKEILGSRLNFKNVIISDDLNMEGANISKHYGDRMLAAREAGCDFTLLCNNRKGVWQILDDKACFPHRVNQEKWQRLCGDFSHVKKPFKESRRWQQTHETLLRMNDDDNA